MERDCVASVNFSTKKWENLTKVLDVLLQEDFSVLIYRDEFGNNILRAIHNVYDEELRFELVSTEESKYTWEEVQEILEEETKTYTLQQAIKELKETEDK